MNRTQKNIKKYEGMLPGLKEKVAAAAMLFAMTAAMLVTSTFAWLTLSTNPQMTDVHTAVASNGNLEIALANSTDAPAESTAIDGSLATALRNLTWGNLINLNDSSYGLKELVLRPALLNEANLIERPLYGPVYDKDGRVMGMNTNFGYSTWTGNQFQSSDALGVRAITSMKYGEDSAQNKYNEYLIEAEAKNAELQTLYLSLADNQEYMDSLASMMTGYLVQNVFRANPESTSYTLVSDATLKNDDLTQFALMYQDLIDIFEAQADVYALLLEHQAKALEGTNDPNLKITGQEILELPFDKTNKTAQNAIKDKGFSIVASKGFIADIDNFLYDYSILKEDLARINQLKSQISSSISWPESPKMDDGTTCVIDNIIGRLVDIKKCKIISKSGKTYTMGNIGASTALELKNDAPCEAVITNGILYNMDNRSGARIKNDRNKDPLILSVSTLIGARSIKSNVSTNATENYFENERAELQKYIKEEYGAPTLVANDSYGFAIDFWVRTNASNSYLTLQGNVLSYIEQVPVTGKDLNGNEVDIYTISVKVEQESDGTEGGTGGILDELATVSYDVYESTYIPEGEQDEVECLRFADSHDVVTKESLGGQDVPTNKTQKFDEIEHITGFEGDNRVWEGEQYTISTTSTTQGSGSCYTFYAESPVDQERSLNLLNSMKIAFVDENGELLTSAYMDTKRHFASAGKVTVPIVLDDASVIIGQDENGKNRYAITSLEQNVPKRISAIVYLDGRELTNDDVLAAADIQGQMNIQFGSSAALVPLDNEKLFNSEFYAKVQNLSEDYFEYDSGEDMTTVVTLAVTGDKPSEIKANFIRKINATQGSPEKKEIVFKDNGDGTWVGSYTFEYPGEYILRSVYVDGVERDLKLDEGETFPTVTVKGFTISSVAYNLSDSIMSDKDYYKGDVTLRFATDDIDKMPKTVVGKFVCDDGSNVNVNFVYNPTVDGGGGAWLGTANFVSSGVYTMQYVLLDGQYTELPENMQKTVDLTLGMRVRIATTSEIQMLYDDNTKNEKLALQVEIVDNNGKLVKNLPGVNLYYATSSTNNQAPTLRYNSNLGYYEGELAVSPGIWRFSHLNIKVGENSTSTLYKANADAPVFTIIPPTPPSFVSNTAPKAVYIVNDVDSAEFTATLQDASSATAYAKVTNSEGKTVYIKNVQEIDGDASEAMTLAEGDSEQRTLKFRITESGLWTVESISVFNVSDKSGRIYSEPAEINDDTYLTGYVFDAEEGFVSSEIAVLCQKDIQIEYEFGENVVVDKLNKKISLGKDKDGNVTATFMQSQTLKGNDIVLTISDKANLIRQGKFSIKDISLAYQYGTLSESNADNYGGYTTDAFVSGTAFDALDFVVSADDNTKFTLTSEGTTFQYAAPYQPSQDNNTKGLRFTVTSDLDSSINAAGRIDDGHYSIDVYSIKPSAKIKSVSPSGSIPTKITYTTKSLSLGRGTEPTFTATGNQTNGVSSDGLSATLYAKATADNDTQRHGGFELPDLTLTVSGVDANSTVNLTLPATDKLSALTFSRTGNGDIAKSDIGLASQINSWKTNWGLYTHTLKAYYGYGENATIDKMTITRDGKSFTVKLDNSLVIKNPNSVNQ